MRQDPIPGMLLGFLSGTLIACATKLAGLNDYSLTGTTQLLMAAGAVMRGLSCYNESRTHHHRAAAYHMAGTVFFYSALSFAASRWFLSDNNANYLSSNTL